MSSARSRRGFRLDYFQYMGGVVGFTPAQFRRINGFSNLFFGWGGEDDNLSWRARQVVWKEGGKKKRTDQGLQTGFHRRGNITGRSVSNFRCQSFF